MKENRMEESEIMDILYRNICKELTEKNWSLRKLSDKADLPYETVKKLFSGKIHRPSFVSIWKISEALEVSMDALMGKDHDFSVMRTKIMKMQKEMEEIINDIKA